MSQIVHALIEHRNSTENILQLPDNLFNSSNSELAGRWMWTNPGIKSQFLHEYWKKDISHFMDMPYNEEALALLVKNDMTIHFLSPCLVTFGKSLNWNYFRKDAHARKEFVRLALSVSSLLNGVDILFIPNLSGVPFFDESEDLTVDAYRKKANGDDRYAIECD